MLPILPDNSQNLDFHSAIDTLLYSLSETSRRIYAHTYQKWLDFAESQNIPYFDMRPRYLITFLESERLSHSTKQARLSHLRHLLQALHAERPDNAALKSMYEQAKMLKVKRQSEESVNQREKHALTRQQVYQAFLVWSEESLVHLRNRALLAILFYCGLRRSEAAALRWADIDLEQMLVHVRHGKGDKARTIPILGADETAPILAAWQKASQGRKYVFCSLRKGNHFGNDAAMTEQAVYNVIKATGDAIGIDFAPHDARRTLITRALAAGTSVSDAQFIAGHSNAETTLRYAVVKDANEVRGRVKLDY